MYPKIDLSNECAAVRDFFSRLPQQTVVVTLQTKAVAVIQTAVSPPVAFPLPESLEELAGAWDALPDEVEEIGQIGP